MRTWKRCFLVSTGIGLLLSIIFAPICYLSIYTGLMSGSVQLSPGLYARSSDALSQERREALSESVRRAYEFVQRRFNLSFKGTVLVEIRSTPEWKALGDTGEFTEGYYVSQDYKWFNLHRVCVPESTSEATLRHEITHALVSEIGETRPVVDEGLAHFSESDDGFNARMASALLSGYPLDTKRDVFCRGGRTDVYDPLLLETESARATGWLMANIFRREGYSLSKIVALRRSDLPKQSELVSEMPEVAFRFALDFAENKAVSNPKCWLTSYWTLRTKYSTEESRRHSEELIEHTGYVADPEYLKCHAWLLALEGAKSGTSSKEALGTRPKEFFERCGKCYASLKGYENEFILRLGAQAVQERGFFEQYAHEIEPFMIDGTKEQNDFLLDILHKYSEGHETSFHPVETRCWAFAYFHLSKGMPLKDFLAYRGPLELTPKMVSELGTMPKLSPSVAASSEASGALFDPEREARRSRYLEERYQERVEYWKDRAD